MEPSDGIWNGWYLKNEPKHLVMLYVGVRGWIEWYHNSVSITISCRFLSDMGINLGEGKLLGLRSESDHFLDKWTQTELHGFVYFQT